jgi:hypothetical protein
MTAHARPRRARQPTQHCRTEPLLTPRRNLSLNRVARQSYWARKRPSEIGCCPRIEGTLSVLRSALARNGCESTVDSRRANRAATRQDALYVDANQAVTQGEAEEG